jgi:hypothetical protein
MGRNIKDANFNPDSVSAFQFGLVSGTYVINAITNNERVGKKIILRQ